MRIIYITKLICKPFIHKGALTQLPLPQEDDMTSGYMIKIFFRDGRTEEHYCDYYEKKNGLLTYYVRFGVESGEHNIPYDLINTFIVTR